MNLSWALQRLSTMSGPEIGYRVRQRVRAGLEQLGLFDGPAPQPQSRRSGRAWVDPLPVHFETERYRRAADEVLAGRWRIFAMRPARLGFPPQWNRDPKTGKVAPLSFGTSIDYRDDSLVGDIKYLWEPSRHAQLVTLAQAWRLSGEVRYAEGCRTLLDSWFEQCPYPLGVHWTSSLEHAVRLINWSFAWRLLGAEQSPLFAGEDGQAFRTRWLEGVYRHCHFIATHFSRFSSANNHLLGELTGLLVASLTWPLWDRSERWRTSAQRELEREALRQNAPDGVNREQANWYHHEVADMMLLAGLTARASGCDFSSEFWRRLRGMLDYIASIMDAGGAVPSFGDADDAVIARLDPSEDFDPYRSLLASGAVLFASPQFKLKADVLDDKTRWLLGDQAEQRFAALTGGAAGLPIKRAFEDAGYYILGRGFETRDELRIVADAGPLGYLSIAAHGHADALSFTLSAGGSELLIDPGTFAYHTQRKWRDYFRGTSAHNTVRIDRQDQSVSGGAFLWRTHAGAKVLEFHCQGDEQRLIAEHDGYMRLSDPVLHRRELELGSGRPQLRVTDHLQCRGVHELEMFWHFAEDCRVEASNHVITARRGRVKLQMTLPETTKVELVRGREEPPLGWISRSFDARTPCCTVRASRLIRGSVHLVTLIEVEFDQSLAAESWLVG